MWCRTRLRALLSLQFHDGLGFLVSHSVLTNTFEYSLQAVNPKLTVPYWDFTIETSSSSDTVYDPTSPYTRTPLLDASWFGTADLEDGMVRFSFEKGRLHRLTRCERFHRLARAVKRVYGRAPASRRACGGVFHARKRGAHVVRALLLYLEKGTACS